MAVRGGCGLGLATPNLDEPLGRLNSGRRIAQHVTAERREMPPVRRPGHPLSRTHFPSPPGGPLPDFPILNNLPWWATLPLFKNAKLANVLSLHAQLSRSYDARPSLVVIAKALDSRRHRWFVGADGTSQRRSDDRSDAGALPSRSIVPIPLCYRGGKCRCRCVPCRERDAVSCVRMARVAQTYAAAHQIHPARPSLRCSVAMTASPMPPVRSLPIGSLACGSVHAAYGTLAGGTGHRMLAVRHRNPCRPACSARWQACAHRRDAPRNRAGLHGGAHGARPAYPTTRSR